MPVAVYSGLFQQVFRTFVHAKSKRLKTTKTRVNIGFLPIYAGFFVVEMRGIEPLTS